ncbi:hypothetical protein GCM10008090_30740 [Arenicella chitinivorans]|uniref:Uncharacterized protein n=1 Tax=Arenicella chitinivorans TaxID=1329800 RepID=A0A918VRX9_9GAMM|nr:hypothetical protein [Arenicella chitinivorans]GHA18925.1 hypothetical protein GCM10008090_30740 [Arenicella chitinivorans]
MIDSPSHMIRQLFGFDHGTVTNANQVHPIREQYPELVGENGISNAAKQNWQRTDWIPIGIIVLFLVSMIVFFGYYKPAARLAKTNADIARISAAFDQRVNQINSMANQLDQFVIDNALPRELQSAVSISRNAVNALAQAKPNEQTIAQRFEAEAKFKQLSEQIIQNRDLAVYGELSELPDDFTDKDVINRGVKTLELVEQWGDRLSSTEREAADLLDIFNNKLMPKRKMELRNSILTEWQDAHNSLLQNWKQLKDLEISLAARAEAIKAANVRQEEIKQAALERQREYERAQAEREALRPKPVKQIRRQQPVNQPKPKQQRKPKKQLSELERRKRAASKLID